MKQCQTLKHGRTSVPSVPSVPSGVTFNGCSGSRWIYMDLPWFTGWIPQSKRGPRQSKTTLRDARPALCRPSSLSNLLKCTASRPDHWISWYHGRYFETVTSLYLYTIPSLYTYIIYTSIYIYTITIYIYTIPSLYILYITHDWSKSPEAVPSVPLYSAWHEILGDLS